MTYCLVSDTIKNYTLLFLDFKEKKYRILIVFKYKCSEKVCDAVLRLRIASHQNKCLCSISFLSQTLVSSLLWLILFLLFSSNLK